MHQHCPPHVPVLPLCAFVSAIEPFEAQLHFFLFNVVFHFTVFLNCTSTSRFPVPHSVRASVVAMATLFRAVLAIFLQYIVQPYGEYTVLLQCIVSAVALQSYFCK